MRYEVCGVGLKGNFKLWGWEGVEGDLCSLYLVLRPCVVQFVGLSVHETEQDLNNNHSTRYNILNQNRWSPSLQINVSSIYGHNTLSNGDFKFVSFWKTLISLACLLSSRSYRYLLLALESEATSNFLPLHYFPVLIGRSSIRRSWPSFGPFMVPSTFFLIFVWGVRCSLRDHSPKQKSW